jgi:hypothetical protein
MRFDAGRLVGRMPWAMKDWALDFEKCSVESGIDAVLGGTTINFVDPTRYDSGWLSRSILED